MAQMTDSLAQSILNGDGITRHEVEQLCHFWLKAQKDAERLDFLAHHSISLRKDPIGNGRWFMVAPYHTGISVIDDHNRFSTTRDAIDAAIDAQIAAQEQEKKG